MLKSSALQKGNSSTVHRKILQVERMAWNGELVKKGQGIVWCDLGQIEGTTSEIISKRTSLGTRRMGGRDESMMNRRRVGGGGWRGGRNWSLDRLDSDIIGAPCFRLVDHFHQVSTLKTKFKTPEGETRTETIVNKPLFKERFRALQRREESAKFDECGEWIRG
jgi:hypothetical protein